MTTDARLERAKALTEQLGAVPGVVAERRRLLTELHAEGMSMSAMAAALGVARTRLYAIVGKGE